MRLGRPVTTRRRHPPGGGPPGLGVLGAMLTIAVLLTACTDGADAPTTAATGASVPPGAASAAPTNPADGAAAADLALLAAVTKTIDAVNAAALADPATQRRVLEQLVDPALLAAQRACAPATVTVRIDPVLDHLRRIDDLVSGSATPTGTDESGDTRQSGALQPSGTRQSGALQPSAATSPDTQTPTTQTPTTQTPINQTPATLTYAMPVLLEVYTGGLRTGTDMTSLRLSIRGSASAPTAALHPLCLI